MLKQLISGAIMMGSWAIALFFLRFWRRTQDRLFACFATAFFLIGFERLVLVWVAESELSAYAYVIRSVAFLVIVFGIINKNKSGARGG